MVGKAIVTSGRSIGNYPSKSVARKDNMIMKGN
jgi:hypothetical protein